MMQNQRISATAAFIAAALIVLAGHTCLADDQPVKTDVFVSGTDGYHTYRIPAVIVTPKGTVLAFCEGRKTSRSDHGDLDLVLRRSSDRGKTWAPMQIVYEEGGDAKITIGNPCPVVDRDTGRIWLPFCRNNDKVLVTYSDDDGANWAKPTEITDSVKKPGWGWYATGPGVGIQLEGGKHRGRLVIPCDHSEQIDGKRGMFSHVFYSDDHGQTWKLGGSADRHTDECQVVELSDGTLMINMRNYWGRDGKQQDKDKMRAVAISRDGGATWGDLRFDPALIEPICQASFLRHSAKGQPGDGRLLFSNPASPTTRHQLTVRLSSDEGKTWPVAKLLHEGPSAYSCLTVLPDGSVGCLYEGGEKHAYEKIIFARFSADSSP
jgi:sialidase-1